MNRIYKEFTFLLAVLLFFGISSSHAQILQSGAQDLCFFSSVDETDQPYAVYIPDDYDESKKYPLVVFLHGAMSNHRLGLRRVFGQGNNQGKDFLKQDHVPEVTDLEATRHYPELKDVNYIVAAPYARGTAGYQGIPEKDVYEMLDQVKERFSINDDRVYLTGLSMGGGGTLWLGLTRPDTWAAIAPVCPAAPEGTQGLYKNASNIPVHIFEGDKGFLYQDVLKIKERFEDKDVNFSYTEYPGIGHNSWEYAYEDGFIFEWFAQFERNIFPRKVSFSTRHYKYSDAYWVTIDKLTPGTLATIKAAFKEDNTLEVTTEAVDAVSFQLEGHELFTPDMPVEVTMDGKTFEVETPDAISFTKENGEWRNKKYTPGLNAKQAGAEGPVEEAISDNHIYVYGTAGDPSQKEQKLRRQKASVPANWSVDRGSLGRIKVFPRVLADEGVRESDYNVSNMVLFGTKETNKIISKHADRLPLHLTQKTGEYGLVYIYPFKENYFLVNSGIPWWKGARSGENDSGGYALPPQLAPLKDFKDFIIFKSSPDNVVVEGYFDHNWKLPESAKDKIQSIEAIEINEM